MNDFTVFIYFIGFAMVAGATFAFMWKMTSETLRTFNNTPVKSYSDAMKSYKMPAPPPV